MLIGVGLVVLQIIDELWFTSPPSYHWSRKAPDRADAVVVLSGDYGDRLSAGLPLVRKGVADTLVLAGTPDSQEVYDLCGIPQPFEVICFVPTPDGTRPEARETAKLAEQRGWQHLIVVTTTHHAARAGMLFRRCFDGKVDVLGTPSRYPRGAALRQLWREWLARVYFGIVDRKC